MVKLGRQKANSFDNLAHKRHRLDPSRNIPAHKMNATELVCWASTSIGWASTSLHLPKLSAGVRFWLRDVY
jgi:hypothetical protein